MAEKSTQLVQREVPAVNETAAIIQVIERAAINPDVDIDKMERLLQMQERIMARQSEAAFHAALADVQADLPEIIEGGAIRHNGKLISKYARWDEDINPAIKPILRAHGFSLSFRVDTDNKVCVEAVLAHKAGHSERTSITLPADTSGSKNPVQAVASSVSYGKRYTAGALLNLTSHGEDDDGRAAVQVARITPEQAANLEALITEIGADRNAFLRYLKVERLEDIAAGAYRDAVRALEAKRKANAG